MKHLGKIIDCTLLAGLFAFAAWFAVRFAALVFGFGIIT